MLPIILSVDDDPQVLQALRRDLRNRYRKEYRIVSTESAHEALEALESLKLKGETVAMLLSDQRMPEMLGVEFLEKAKVLFPEAKRLLLTAYSDTDAAIKAINEVQLDYYLMKPWDPPEEKLYPVIDDQLDEWAATHKPAFKGIRVVGFQFSPKSHKVKDYLSGNLTPYQWLDIEKSGTAKQLMGLSNLSLKELPATFFEDGTVVVGDNLPAIAEKLGQRTHSTAELYDVVIIGAGPAGLAAGVYGGSEGLKTLIIEKRAPGGQAGTSSRIENYLGFPKGLSGGDLTRRAVTQASRFGVEFLSPKEVVKISQNPPVKTITLSDGEVINTKSIVIATGVDYRKLPAKGAEALSGAGVYYGAATTEASACKNQIVYVIGGGNSAGQGAMYLSQFAQEVHILVRKENLEATMSSYLIDQINATPNITVHGKRQVVEVRGENKLGKVCVENLDSGDIREEDASAVFVFIGAKPFTAWLGNGLLKNDKGFVITGRDLLLQEGFQKVWPLEREPLLLETCVPGIFAAGDVGAGAMNRVASATGEGAMAISLVHKYLAEV